MIRLKSVFFCDDVRSETGNKISAMGIYNEALLFQPGTGPIGLPKLAAVFIVAGLKGISDIRWQQSVSFGDKTNTLPEATLHRPDTSNDEQNFLILQMPAVFPGTGTLTARLRVAVDGEEEKTFEAKVEIRRGNVAPAPAPIVSSPN